MPTTLHLPLDGLPSRVSSTAPSPQDRPHPEADPLAHDPGYASWFLTASLVKLIAFSTGGRASMSFVRMVLVGPLKVFLNLNVLAWLP